MTQTRNSSERSEEHSRVKRGNESKPTYEPHKNPKTSFNTHLRQVHSKTKSFGKVMETVIQNQWETNFRPEWFITIHWNDLPTSYAQVEGHTKHLRNVFLTQLMRCGSPRELPDPPGRPSAIFFHERSPVICRSRQILPFHTHLHLEKLPSPLNEQWYLDVLLKGCVAPKVKKLLKTTTKGNEGVVIKRWNRKHHGSYNLKDYYKYKHHQDSDLVLDYKNSVLLF
jgi:hypothetical protein